MMQMQWIPYPTMTFVGFFWGLGLALAALYQQEKWVWQRAWVLPCLPLVYVAMHLVLTLHSELRPEIAYLSPEVGYLLAGVVLGALAYILPLEELQELDE
jgi:hypothetical protein